MMAAELGVKVTEIRLRAIISNFYGQRSPPVSFLCFTADHVGGKPEIPPGCEAITWVPLAEAADRIDLDDMAMVATHVAAGSDSVLGGAVRILKTDTTRTVTVTEPLRPL